jgi:cytochrome c oxidase subunit I
MQPLIPLHKFITVAAMVTGAAQLIFVYNLIHSRFWGKPASDNPWQCNFPGVEHAHHAAAPQ